MHFVLDDTLLMYTPVGSVCNSCNFSNSFLNTQTGMNYQTKICPDSNPVIMHISSAKLQKI